MLNCMSFHFPVETCLRRHQCSPVITYLCHVLTNVCSLVLSVETSLSHCALCHCLYSLCHLCFHLWSFCCCCFLYLCCLSALCWTGSHRWASGVRFPGWTPCLQHPPPGLSLASSSAPRRITRRSNSTESELLDQMCQQSENSAQRVMTYVL